MQMINLTNPTATNAVNQQSAGNGSPMNAGSELIAKMFQNQGGIGGDLMKMLMNPSSLQSLQGDAAQDSDSVESTGDGSSAATRSSAASDQGATDGAEDAGVVLEKLMDDLKSLMNILKNQIGDGKQMQQAQHAQGQNQANGGQSTGNEAKATNQPSMGSSSNSQSASNSANGDTATTNTTSNTKDGVITSTNDPRSGARSNNLDSANGTPAVMTAGSLNQASLNREAQAVNSSFKGANLSPKSEAMPTSLDGSTPSMAGTQPANSFNLNGTINDGKPVGSADLKLGDVNVKARLDDASELSVGAAAKLTPSTTATLSGDKNGVDAGVKFDDGNTNVGAKVNNIGGPDTNAQFDVGTKIGESGSLQGSYNTNGTASVNLGFAF